MVATVENQSGTFYVNNKPENVPAGNLGGAGTHVKVENEKVAKEIAESVNTDAVQTATPTDVQAKKVDVKV